MKTSLTVLCLISSFTLVACEQQTPGGKIPDNAVGAAQKFMGSYKGGMDGGSSGVLSLSLSGNKVLAKFSKNLLSCGGKIGDLQSVDASGSQLTKATFALSGANCVQGNQLVLTVSNDQRTFSAQVVESVTTETVCPSQSQIQQCQASWSDDSNCGDNNGSATYQNCLTENRNQYGNCDSCDSESSYTYVNGTFKR